MATAELNKVIGHLRSVLSKQDAAELTDGDLVKRYLQQRDEAAFEALVRRHGPMVLGVCRRILRNPQDAEDAFQATFLVFLHKASSLRSSSTVGNWLYGVAYRTGQEARRAILKRRTKEAKVVPKSEASADALNDLREALDMALERLPEKYRTVIVLSDLEGATDKQVALRLGVPEGTVASRLARGRAMLAKRLTRTGLSITAAALAGVLSQKAVSACVPPSLMVSTMKAASLFATGKMAVAGQLSAKVVTLTEGVLKTMLLTKLKIVTAVLFMIAVGAFGGGLYMHKAGAQQGPVEKPPAVAEKSEREKGGDPIPSSDDLRGKWKGEKNGIKVDLTFTGEKAHWQVDFVKTRKAKEAFESPNVGVGIGADLKCVPDVKAGRLNLYLPAYLGNDKELKKYPVLTGRAAVGEITRGADRTIQLRIIPTGYENLDQVEYDYPAVEGLILRRTAMNDLEKLQATWVAVSGEERGVQIAEKRLREAYLTLTVNGDQFTLQKTGQAKGLEGTLKIDQARQPKTMDWSADKPDHAKGIYHLEGDTLKFCWGTDRPTEFKTTDDPNLDARMYVFKRKQAPGDSGKAEKMKDDRKQIQGVWKVVGIEVNGEKVDDNEIAKLKWIFTDETITWSDGKNKFLYKLNPTTKPAQMDLTFPERKTDTTEGIYSLDGDDLKVCIGKTGRPTDFSAKAGTKRFLYILKREVFITSVGEHKLYDGKWVVRVVEEKGKLRLSVTRVFDPKGTVKEKTITVDPLVASDSPWFIFAPSADVVWVYDGDKDIRLLEYYKGKQEGFSLTAAILPEGWVGLMRQPPQEMVDRLPTAFRPTKK